jgi:XTP/dITP diphosphohydrolase
MKKLVIASKNPGKIEEFKKFLKDPNFKILSLKDVGVYKDVEEAGKTYWENSKIKAVFYAKLINLPVISDDAGLEIDALNGEPGINSRRWLGRHSTDEELIKHLLKVSKTLPENNRKAIFRTVITLALPNGKYFQAMGKVNGVIAKKPANIKLKGYPFRMFFYFPKIKKYDLASELSKEEEKIYNHRYKAIAKLKPIIKRELGLLI